MPLKNTPMTSLLVNAPQNFRSYAELKKKLKIEVILTQKINSLGRNLKKNWKRGYLKNVIQKNLKNRYLKKILPRVKYGKSIKS